MKITHSVGFAVADNQDDNQRNPRHRGRPMLCVI
jgi:hypothetical protein